MRTRPFGALAWLAVVTAVAVTARLGIWQLDRAAQKTALERSWDEHDRLPPLRADQLPRRGDELEAQLYRRIEVTGRWLPRHTVALDNRPLHGQAGFVVVTPLLLAHGDAVLVQRGWVPRDATDRTRLPVLDVPTGDVHLEARVAGWPSHRLALGAAEHGAIRQNLDAAQMAQEVGAAFRPLSLQQLPGSDARDTFVREWTPPTQDVWKNQGYALQWFAISALIAGLTVWYRLIRPRRGQRS